MSAFVSWFGGASGRKSTDPPSTIDGRLAASEISEATEVTKGTALPSAQSDAPNAISADTTQHASPDSICSLKVDNPFCKACLVSFSKAKRRYCMNCGLSFCAEHLQKTHTITSQSSKAHPVCNPCHASLEEDLLRSRVAQRVERIDQFLNGTLIPYTQKVEDTYSDKALRVARGAIIAANALPLPYAGAKVKYTIKGLDLCRRYGIYALGGLMLQEDVFECIQTLIAVTGEIEGLRFADVTVGLYYLMAYRRGQGGALPTLEEDEHVKAGSVPSNGVMDEITWFAPFAFHIPYAEAPTDVQRLARHREFTLVDYCRPDVDKRKPTFYILASKEKQLAIMTIRGTDSVADVVTDLQAQPQPIEYTWASSFSAHSGILSATLWVHQEMKESLIKLHTAGYRVVITGHSLGAGVAALLAFFLRRDIPTVHAFAFAPPACTSIGLAIDSQDCVTSIVMHDDIVPRVSGGSIQQLIDEIKAMDAIWRGHASEDLGAFWQRLYTLWAPKFRESEADAGCNPADRAQDRNNAQSSGPGPDPGLEPSTDPPPSTANSLGIDCTPSPAHNLGSNPNPKCTLGSLAAGTIPCPNHVPDLGSNTHIVEDNLSSVTSLLDHPPALPLDGSQLYPPGRIVHIYFAQGVLKAAFVKQNFPGLCQIVPTNSIVKEHKGSTYWEALQNLKAARGAAQKPPNWQSYRDSVTCPCCWASFTWNATSNSEAQQNRSKRNCRACGRVVCEDCSSRQMPLGHMGMPYPVRVCDACFLTPTGSIRPRTAHSQDPVV